MDVCICLFVWVRLGYVSGSRSGSISGIIYLEIA